MVKNREQILDDNLGARDAVVDSIITSSREENKGNKTIEISYGRKVMRIEIRSGTEISGGKLVTTFIENIKPETEKKEDETTLLYLTAKKIIQQTANANGEVLCYLFDTENGRMKNWAETVGQDIFEWDSRDTMSTQENQHTFIKRFYPIKNPA